MATRIKKFDDADVDEDDPDFTPPCLAAQQCTSIMFGLIIGYSALLLFVGRGYVYGDYVCCVVIGGASVFGYLGSKVSNPFFIHKEEFLKLSLLVITVSFSCVQLLQFDLLGVFAISLLDLMVATAGSIFLVRAEPISKQATAAYRKLGTKSANVASDV
jgi:hypothetical protein